MRWDENWGYISFQRISVSVHSQSEDVRKEVQDNVNWDFSMMLCDFLYTFVDFKFIKKCALQTADSVTVMISL